MVIRQIRIKWEEREETSIFMQSFILTLITSQYQSYSREHPLIISNKIDQLCKRYVYNVQEL